MDELAVSSSHWLHSLAFTRLGDGVSQIGCKLGQRLATAGTIVINIDLDAVIATACCGPMHCGTSKFFERLQDRSLLANEVTKIATVDLRQQRGAFFDERDFCLAVKGLGNATHKCFERLALLVNWHFNAVLVATSAASTTIAVAIAIAVTAAVVTAAITVAIAVITTTTTTITITTTVLATTTITAIVACYRACSNGFLLTVITVTAPVSTIAITAITVAIAVITTTTTITIATTVLATTAIAAAVITTTVAIAIATATRATLFLCRRCLGLNAGPHSGFRLGAPKEAGLALFDYLNLCVGAINTQQVQCPCLRFIDRTSGRNNPIHCFTLSISSRDGWSLNRPLESPDERPVFPVFPSLLEQNA